MPKDATKNRPFVTLVTSAFPSVKVKYFILFAFSVKLNKINSHFVILKKLFKEQSQLLKELQEARYFDSFSFNAQMNKWVCFGCAYPEKVK